MNEQHPPPTPDTKQQDSQTRKKPKTNQNKPTHILPSDDLIPEKFYMIASCNNIFTCS